MRQARCEESPSAQQRALAWHDRAAGRRSWSDAARALQDLDNIVDRARHNGQLLKAVDGDEHIVLDAHTAKAAEATQHGSVDEARLRGVGQRSVEQLQNER